MYKTSILLLSILSLFTACIHHTPKAEDHQHMPIKEGVEFLQGDQVKSTFCYRYSLDEGEFSAYNRVEKIALKNAIEASREKIDRMFEKNVHCTDKSMCAVQKKKYFRQVRNNYYNNVHIMYKERSSQRVCISTIGYISEIVIEKN